LVNGHQLYDVLGDPAQQNDVSTTYPDTVSQLQLAYNNWWKTVSVNQHDYVRIGLGGPEKPAQLTCHDLHPDGNGQATAAWNQLMIEQGKPLLTGFWAVDVLRPGAYRIILRRWPAESARTRAPKKPPARPEPVYKEAHLSVGGQSRRIPVSSAETNAVFTLTLPQGPTQLRGDFVENTGNRYSAFYVSVEPLF
jgi:hypothetical protein